MGNETHSDFFIFIAILVAKNTSKLNFIRYLDLTLEINNLDGSQLPIQLISKTDYIFPEITVIIGINATCPC